MRGNSTGHPLNHLGDPGVVPDVRGSAIKVLIRCLIGGAVLWLMGIQFTAGWHFATTGSPDFARSIGDGFIFVIAGGLAAIAAYFAKFHFHGIPSGVALALAIIVVEGAFPIGAILGCIHNSSSGAFPDISGLGNSLSDIFLNVFR